MNGSSRDGHWVYGFLRIGDPTVTEVEVSLQGLTEWQQEEQTWERKEVARLRTTAEDWTEKDGYRYALVWADVREYSGDIYYGSVYFHATAYDAAGTMAAEYDSYDAEWTGVSG